MSTHCGCATCRNPAGDEATKTVHDARHRLFESIVSEQPDRHGFRPPTLTRIVELHAAEFSVSTACVRHPGTISHPASHR